MKILKTFRLVIFAAFTSCHATLSVTVDLKVLEFVKDASDISVDPEFGGDVSFIFLASGNVDVSYVFNTNSDHLF